MGPGHMEPFPAVSLFPSYLSPPPNTHTRSGSRLSPGPPGRCLAAWGAHSHILGRQRTAHLHFLSHTAASHIKVAHAQTLERPCLHMSRTLPGATGKADGRMHAPIGVYGALPPPKAWHAKSGQSKDSSPHTVPETSPEPAGEDTKRCLPGSWGFLRSLAVEAAWGWSPNMESSPAPLHSMPCKG